MNDEPIEDIYFNWLYQKVAYVECPTPSLTYWKLFKHLYSTEFVWLVACDDNRVKDGLDLRIEFHRNVSMSSEEESIFMFSGCSVLECLIAFCRRAEFLTDISAKDWFWKLLDNLKLSDLNDAKENFDHYALEVLDRFVWRTYKQNGEGGLFPLKNTNLDQRKVEIWYQFCEYLTEEELI